MADGRISYRLSKAFWTGPTHVVLSPVDLLRRLAALGTPPRFHPVRFHGLFASASRDRINACARAPGDEAESTNLDGNAAWA
ncbi:MAG: transposase [Kofleriaceae bacterium]|nr:transposase [Kofleriaceae bacterium]